MRLMISSLFNHHVLPTTFNLSVNSNHKYKENVTQEAPNMLYDVRYLVSREHFND